MEHFALHLGYGITALAVITLAGYSILVRGDNPTIRSFGFAVGFLAFWAVGVWGRLVAATVTGSLIWDWIAYIGIGFVTAFWLIFALRYTGRERYVTKPIISVLIIPAVTWSILIGTNPLHSLYYTDVQIVDIYGHPYLETDVTWLFYWFTIYHYILFSVAVVLLVTYAIRSHRRYLIQSSVLVIGATFPFLVNVVYIWNVVEFPVDPTPFAFGISALLVSIPVLHSDFIDIMPIARDRLLDVIDDAIVIVDDTDRIIDINSSARAILRSPDGGDLIGRSLDSIKPDVKSTQVAEAAEDRNGHVIEIEGDRWYLVRDRPVQYGNESVGRIYVLTDISVQKRQERTLKRQNERLDAFARVVSHDIKNPLNIIGGSVELAMETGDIDHLDPVPDTVEELNAFINDLLALSQRGETIDERQAIDLESLLDGVWRRIGEPPHRIEIRSSATVYGDRIGLQRVFENFVQNAIVHGPHGEGEGVTVTVDVAGQSDGSGYINLEDDGKGIPDEVADDLFSRGVTTNSYGTGLGLAIVREIIEAHGWSVRLAEADGGGARFEIHDVDFVSEETPQSSETGARTGSTR